MSIWNYLYLVNFGTPKWGSTPLTICKCKASSRVNNWKLLYEPLCHQFDLELDLGYWGRRLNLEHFKRCQFVTKSCSLKLNSTQIWSNLLRDNMSCESENVWWVGWVEGFWECTCGIVFLQDTLYYYIQKKIENTLWLWPSGTKYTWLIDHR